MTAPVRSSLCFCAGGCDRNPMSDPHTFPPCECWCHDEQPRRWTRAEVGEDAYCDLLDTIDMGDQ